MELRGAELENYGVEPRREADESKGEDYVYGQSNSGVGARVESLFLVDEECNYLRQKVRNVECNEERKSAALTLDDRIVKYEPYFLSQLSHRKNRSQLIPDVSAQESGYFSDHDAKLHLQMTIP